MENFFNYIKFAFFFFIFFSPFPPDGTLNFPFLCFLPRRTSKLMKNASNGDLLSSMTRKFHLEAVPVANNENPSGIL